MTTRSYYDILEVSPHASADVIKAAYRSLMQRYHPDRTDAQDAVQRAQEINDAYAVLSDPAKRRAFDALIEQSAGGERPVETTVPARETVTPASPPPQAFTTATHRTNSRASAPPKTFSASSVLGAVMVAAYGLSTCSDHAKKSPAAPPAATTPAQPAPLDMPGRAAAPRKLD